MATTDDDTRRAQVLVWAFCIAACISITVWFIGGLTENRDVQITGISLAGVFVIAMYVVMLIHLYLARKER